MDDQNESIMQGKLSVEDIMSRPRRSWHREPMALMSGGQMEEDRERENESLGHFPFETQLRGLLDLGADGTGAMDGGTDLICAIPLIGLVLPWSTIRVLDLRVLDPIARIRELDDPIARIWVLDLIARIRVLDLRVLDPIARIWVLDLIARIRVWVLRVLDLSVLDPIARIRVFDPIARIRVFDPIASALSRDPLTPVAGPQHNICFPGVTLCGTKGEIILRGNENPMLLKCKLGEIGFPDAKAVRSVRRRPVRNRQGSEEHYSEVGAITERRERRDDSSSSSGNPRLGPPPTFAVTSEGNDHYFRHIHPFADLASTFIRSDLVLVLGSYQLFLADFPLIHRFADSASIFNLGALAFVLGSYELLLSNPLFWMCWCILVTKAVIKSLQPYWEWIESERIRDDNGRAGAIIFKLGMSIALIALLKCSQNTTHRANTILLILAASIFLFEGLTPLLIGTEGFDLRRDASGTITGVQKCKALIFFSPSALNAMIAMTGPIILAGDLGHLMRDEAFWGFLFILLVDVFAEYVPGLVSGRRSPFVMSEDLPKIHHVVVILRVIVEGCLCCWMGKVINGDSYFPSDLGMDDCNKLCRERSKQLLITMVALGGLQAAGTFITSLCCVLGHCHGPAIPLFVRPHIASD